MSSKEMETAQDWQFDNMLFVTTDWESFFMENKCL